MVILGLTGFDWVIPSGIHEARFTSKRLKQARDEKDVKDSSDRKTVPSWWSGREGGGVGGGCILTGRRFLFISFWGESS